MAPALASPRAASRASLRVMLSMMKSPWLTAAPRGLTTGNGVFPCLFTAAAGLVQVRAGKSLRSIQILDAKRTNGRAILSAMNATTPGKRAATRELILDHAYDMARRDGLEGLSIGSLAADVGMSKSGLFAHFGSREELQLAVLETGQLRFLQNVKWPALKLPRGLARVRAIVTN